MTQDARDRLEAALARIADPAGDGAVTCLTVYAEAARAAADAADARAKAGFTHGPLDGRIVTIKDLFDVAGEPTRAGSRILADAAPATADAAIVQRLRRAGAVIVAKTNMVEFAYSGIGWNPHYGTPRNPAAPGRAPGGSSSGAAASVGHDFCDIAIGSDTGGSCRVPAGFCGIVGYKPTVGRVPTTGAFPLSWTLDSIGPLARTVRDCALTDAILAGEEAVPPAPAELSGLRLGVFTGLPLEGLDPATAAAFQSAVTQLTQAGAHIRDHVSGAPAAMQAANASGGVVAPEAYAVHRAWFDTRKAAFDPRVWTRISAGQRMSAADYIAVARERVRLTRAFDAEIAGYDALILPTTPTIAPLLADLAEDDAFFAANGRALRNTFIGNFLGLCAISLPLPVDGPPVGLMLCGRAGADHRLFAIAQAVETALKG